MPIYAYRCQACGFAKDILQKISDPVLTECPECHQATFVKQLTAAGFHLKGTGWYVTDFRDGQKKAAPAAAKSDEGAGAGGSTEKSADSTAASTPAPATSASKDVAA